MKRAKAAVAVLLFAPLLLCSQGAVPTEEPPAVEYVSIYPVQPDDPEWAELTSASEMLAALMEREDAASAIVARLEQPRTRAGTSMEELTLLIIASDPRIEQQLTAEERDVVAECVEYRMPAAAAHAEKEGI